MAARRASDILASLRLSSLVSLVPALFLPPSTFSACSFFRALPLCFIYISNFIFPGFILFYSA